MLDEKHAQLRKGLKKIVFENRRFIQKCRGRFLTAAVVAILFFTVVVVFSPVKVYRSDEFIIELILSSLYIAIPERRIYN